MASLTGMSRGSAEPRCSWLRVSARNSPLLVRCRKSGIRYLSSSRCVIIPISEPEASTTGVARMSCSTMRRATSPSVWSGPTVNACGVMTSRTMSCVGSSTASNAASAMTWAGLEARSSASAVSESDRVRASAPTTCRYSAASRRGATMKITIRAVRLGSFSQWIGVGEMPTAVARVRTASVRKCGRNACSPTLTMSSGQVWRMTALRRCGSATAPAATRRSASRSVASLTVVARSGTTMCSGFSTSRSFTSAP